MAAGKAVCVMCGQTTAPAEARAFRRLAPFAELCVNACVREILVGDMRCVQR